MRHPGEFIREEIPTELNLSATRAAHIPGVRRATLSDLMNEKVSLSPEMALRIEKAFGVPWTPCRAAEIEVQRYESVR